MSVSRRALFIGGTGNLSYDCSLRALDQGWDLSHINRGVSGRHVTGARVLRADARDEDNVRSVVGSTNWDVVVDFISFEPDQVERARRVFEGRTGQYVFISSASCYVKPPLGGPLTEDTPLGNPYWEYSRSKIISERYLTRAQRESGFPVTIVRPSHTYGATWIPSWFGSTGFTTAARMAAGMEIPVFGNGSTRWTLTHARDFAVGLVGLMGNAGAIGTTVQVTGDDAPDWNSLYATLADLLGAEFRPVYIPVEFIATHDPGFAERLLGDKAYDTVFDCSRLKSLVPAFSPSVSLKTGLKESLKWHRQSPERMRPDPVLNARLDALIRVWRDLSDSA